VVPAARRLQHLPELQAKTRQVNHRLLMIERAGQGCAIESALFERISQLYAREGQRTGALRFGDPRVMALAGALGVMVHAVSGSKPRSSTRRSTTESSVPCSAPTPAPQELRRAIATIDHVIEDYVAGARLKRADAVPF
jgi:hypothetical protein